MYSIVYVVVIDGLYHDLKSLYVSTILQLLRIGLYYSVTLLTIGSIIPALLYLASHYSQYLCWHIGLTPSHHNYTL